MLYTFPKLWHCKMECWFLLKSIILYRTITVCFQFNNNYFRISPYRIVLLLWPSVHDIGTYYIFYNRLYYYTPQFVLTSSVEISSFLILLWSTEYSSSSRIYDSEKNKFDFRNYDSQWCLETYFSFEDIFVAIENCISFWLSLTTSVRTYLGNYFFTFYLIILINIYDSSNFLFELNISLI